MRETKLTSPEKIQETLAKALNPDTLKDLIFEQNLKKTAEERKLEESIQAQKESSVAMPAFGLFRSQSIFETIKKDVAPFDPLSKPSFKQRLQGLIDEHILPLEEAQRSIKN